MRELIIEGEKSLLSASSSARLDAELLLCLVIGCERLGLIARSNESVPSEAESRFRTLLERRSRGEPVAYLLGEQEFYGLRFEVSPAVLIPRPETELLVEQALLELTRRDSRRRVLDLGTGSGCVIVSLASELVRRGLRAELTAVDKSADALAVAKRNASRHPGGDAIRFLQSNWFSSLSGEVFDLVVGNPPYVEEGSLEVSREVHFEPEAALYSGPQGTDDIFRILGEAPRYLAPGGVVLLECGYRQGCVASDERFASDFSARSVIKDLAGKDRVLRFET
jgi:release factor glutamine methyltransferase